MTVLHSNDFEATTAGTIPTGWSDNGGSGLRVQAGVGLAGTKGYGNASQGDSSLWGGNYTANSAIRFAYIVSGSHTMEGLLRAQSYDRWAQSRASWDGTNLTCRIMVRDNGTIAEISGGSVACAGGSLVHFEFRVTGSSYETRVWVEGSARPASATLALTSSFYASGYQGLSKVGGFGGFYVDNVVITDAAGGEDFFYGSPTLTGSVTLDDMAPTGSMSMAPAISLGGSVLLDEMLADGTLGLQPGVITSQPFKNASGTLLTGLTIPKVAVIRVSNMVTDLVLTNQVTNGAGVLSVTSGSLLPGVQYLLVTCNADGTAFGAEPYVAT